MLEKLEAKIKEVKDAIEAAAINMEESYSMNSKMDEAKRNIAAAFGEIGEAFYAQNKEAAPEGFEELFAKITENEAVIDECDHRLKVLAGIRTCPGCGADVEKGHRFCILCGTRIPEEEKPAVSGKCFCEQCGTEAEEGSAFCTNCGAPITFAPAAPVEKLCKRCGSKLSEGAKFCEICGERVEE